MSRTNDPGPSEFSTARSAGRTGRSTGALPTATITPPIAPGMEYRGTIATDVLAEAVESQARLLATRRPTTAPRPRTVRRAEY